MLLVMPLKNLSMSAARFEDRGLLFGLIALYLGFLALSICFVRLFSLSSSVSIWLREWRGFEIYFSGT